MSNFLLGRVDLSRKIRTVKEWVRNILFSILTTVAKLVERVSDTMFKVMFAQVF